MTITSYKALKKQLDFEPSLFVTLTMLAIDILLLWFAVSLVRTHYLISQFIFAATFFRGFTLLHEAGHNNTSKSKWLNVVIGHIASLYCFIPFFQWQALHREHHYWTGNVEKDPTLAGLRNYKPNWFISFCWKWRIPVFFLHQLTLFWKYERGNRFSVSFLTAIYLILLPSLIFILPAFLLYAIWSEVINLPHHIGTERVTDRLYPWEQHRATRSCYYPPWMDIFTVNFNFHTEHHLFPALPWFRLRELRELIKDEEGYQQDNWGRGLVTF